MKNSKTLFISIFLIFSLVVLLIGMVYAVTVTCQENFTTCTEGGCDANPGWWATDCYIYGCTAAPTGFECKYPKKKV
ncbi:hypothetical protein NLB65_01985 [Candidatus Aminicenantes bacterium AC-335-B20]|jgi:hypothetical protein|nr:hypothetical protein [Candidatus Aminicenantes bacterium AC-335-B20]